MFRPHFVHFVCSAKAADKVAGEGTRECCSYNN